MSKQFTIITKDGSKWLRPVLNPSDTGQLSRFFQNAGDGFEDLPYIGTRPEGTTVDESEVMEVTQYRPKDTTNADWKTWTEGAIKWDNVVETRTAYTDAESHDHHISADYWRKRCEAAESLLNAEAELEHNLITAEEYEVVREEWERVVTGGEMKTYNYTTSQFEKFRDMPEYFENGAIINVTNTKTKKVTTYVVETKKVFTQTSKDWTH